MHETVVYGDAGSPVRRSRRRVGWILAVAVLLVAAACGSDDDEGAEGEEQTARLATEVAGGKAVTEDKLPAGFEAAPTTTVDGQERKFDTIPGHYWKMLDNNYAIGLHFQSEEPFRWAKDAEDDELLYIVYAVPGSCEGLNFTKAMESTDSSVLGAPPPGFDHWHGLVGDETPGTNGHWLMHVPVRDFTFAGMEGNPLDGKKLTAGVPEFVPVCEPAMMGADAGADTGSN